MATLAALVGTLGFSATVACAADPITEQEAHAIGVDAYVYFYPLLSMDITRKQFTNIEPGKAFGKGPMNMFVNVPEYPPADFKGVVRSNFDTLYSIAWLDMSKEPVVITVPDQPGGVTRKLAAAVPVVRQPGDAKTSVHMSSIGRR